MPQPATSTRPSVEDPAPQPFEHQMGNNVAMLGEFVGRTVTAVVKNLYPGTKRPLPEPPVTAEALGGNSARQPGSARLPGSARQPGSARHRGFEVTLFKNGIQIHSGETRGSDRTFDGDSVCTGTSGRSNTDAQEPTSKVDGNTGFQRRRVFSFVSPSGRSGIRLLPQRRGDFLLQRIFRTDPNEKRIYVYPGYGGDIPVNPVATVTLIGKFIQDQKYVNRGTSRFLGRPIAKSNNYPGYSSKFVSRGDQNMKPEPGKLVFLDVEQKRYDAFMEQGRLQVGSDPAFNDKDDAEKVAEAQRRGNDLFWVNCNLPFLEKAFKRGDIIRLVSNPLEFFNKPSGGYFHRELVAIGINAVEPIVGGDGHAQQVTMTLDPSGLANRYGYTWDPKSFSFIRKNESPAACGETT